MFEVGLARSLLVPCGPKTHSRGVHVSLSCQYACKVMDQLSRERSPPNPYNPNNLTSQPHKPTVMPNTNKFPSPHTRKPNSIQQRPSQPNRHQTSTNRCQSLTPKKVSHHSPCYNRYMCTLRARSPLSTHWSGPLLCNSRIVIAIFSGCGVSDSRYFGVLNSQNVASHGQISCQLQGTRSCSPFSIKSVRRWMDSYVC